MATLIVNTGHAITTGRMIGATPAQAEPRYVGWGTGAGTTSATDTTLFGEKAADLVTATGARATGTSTETTTTVTNDTYQVTATITATGAGTVTNAGLFDNAAIGSGNLYMKGDFAGIGLATGDSITFTIQVKHS